MQLALRAQYRLSREDSEELLRIRCRQEWYGILLTLIPAIGCTLLAFGAAGLFYDRRHLRNWTSLAVLGAILVLVRRFVFWAEWRSKRKVVHPFEIVLDETGIVARGPGDEEHYEWSDFSNFKETKRHFVLFHHRKVLLLPKRAFTTQDLNVLSTFLRRNLLAYVPRA